MTSRTAMFMCVRLTFLILMLVYHLPQARKIGKWEEIKIPLCKNLNYNKTYMPNRFLHEDQEEAALEVHQFCPLVQINCSPILKFFLCSLYAPYCDKHNRRELPPCRSVCEQAKTGCLPLMTTFGYFWPGKMECHLFPEKKDDPLCIMSGLPSPSSPTVAWDDITTRHTSWKSNTTKDSRIWKPRPAKTDVSHKFTQSLLIF